MLKRLSNTGTIIGIASAIIGIIATLGIPVDADKYMHIVQALCSIGVLLGFMNNPNTSGLDNPMKKHEVKG